MKLWLAGMGWTGGRIDNATTKCRWCCIGKDGIETHGDVRPKATFMLLGAGEREGNLIEKLCLGACLPDMTGYLD